jgi:hypothetical protein
MNKKRFKRLFGTLDQKDRVKGGQQLVRVAYRRKIWRFRSVWEAERLGCWKIHIQW